MAEPEGGCRELVVDAGRAGWVVVCVAARRLQAEGEPSHRVWAEHSGQELVVGDVLDDGDDDPPCLLVNRV